MNFSQALKHVFQNYATFGGRARRSEYWYFMLLNAIVSVFLFTPLVFAAWVYFLAVAVPSLAVTCRRLQDTGRGPAYLLLCLVPFGPIVILVWTCMDSQPGPNQYGPNPKEGNRTDPVPRAALAVRCLSGPLQGHSYRLSAKGLVFGRDPGCDVRFPLETPGVSRRHCALRMDQGVPVLVDLGSTSGTYMEGGKRLPPSYPEPMIAGARFYLGSKQQCFQIVSPGYGKDW